MVKFHFLRAIMNYKTSVSPTYKLDQ